MPTAGDWRTYLEPLGDILSARPYSASREIVLQDQVEEQLAAYDIRYCREAVVENDRVDFLVAGCVALECKIAGTNSPTEVMRQLQRYAQHEGVEAILLLTTSAQHAHAMPSTLAGKALHVVLVRTGL